MIIDKLFIKDFKNVNDEKVRVKYGLLASFFGIISNIIVCSMKIIVGFLSSTISIIADGINNLADALSSIVSLLGFKLSQRKADVKHPYGHERIENIAGFIVSVIICVLGVQLIISSTSKLINKEESEGKFLINIIVLSISIIIKLYQSIFNYRIGKKIKSNTLIATAIDSRNDVISTFAVLIGLIITYFTGFNLDGYLGILVGVFVCVSGYKLILVSSSTLIGEAPDQELIKQLRLIVKQHDIVLGMHDLEIHSYGPSKMFAVFHAEVDSKGDLVEIHDDLDILENEIKTKLGISTTIHIDPILVGDKKTDDAKEMVIEILSKNLPYNFSIHDFRATFGPTHTNLIFDVVIPYGLKESDEEIAKIIFNLINDYDKTIFCVVNIDHDYSNILSD